MHRPTSNVTRELSENAVSGDLDDTPAPSGNRRIDQLAAQPLPRARPSGPDMTIKCPLICL